MIQTTCECGDCGPFIPGTRVIFDHPGAEGYMGWIADIDEQATLETEYLHYLAIISEDADGEKLVPQWLFTVPETDVIESPYQWEKLEAVPSV